MSLPPAGRTRKCQRESMPQLSRSASLTLTGAAAIGGVIVVVITVRSRRRHRLLQHTLPEARCVEVLSDLVSDAEVADFLSKYDAVRGFIPEVDPLTRLPQRELRVHEELVEQLPSLLEAGLARGTIRRLPLVDLANLLKDDHERRRALLVFSALAQAYIWGGGPDVVPLDRLPACIAIPLHTVSRSLRTAPVLSHMSTCLYNWARLDDRDMGQPSRSAAKQQHAPLRACDLRTTVSFTGDAKEAFFNLIGLEIEAKGGPAVAALVKARCVSVRVLRNDVPLSLVPAAHELVVQCLSEVQGRIADMTSSLLSMPKGIPPSFFYHRFRPYLSGWKGNINLPRGVVFEGVQWGRRQCYSGGSAAQSSLIVSLDLLLGVHHHTGVGRTSYSFLRSMRDYMPYLHHLFLDHLEFASLHAPHLTIRALAMSLDEHHPVAVAYDACLSALAEFRTKHMGIVALYILAQQRRASSKEEEKEEREEEALTVMAVGLEGAAGGKGTGGQDLNTFLRPLRDQTQLCRRTGAQ